MSANKDAKVVEVSEIKDKLGRASGVVLVEYAGMNVMEVTDLRNQLRKSNVEYKVLKNTLVNLAANELNITGLEPFLKGSTAVAFGYDDPTAPAKVMAEYMKKNEKTNKLHVKCGLVDSKLIQAAEVDALAKIPAKEVLVAKLLGTMNAPITNFVGILNGPARALVCALKAVQDQKEQQPA
jgi:large subunit ribosomal protein L10